MKDTISIPRVQLLHPAIRTSVEVAIDIAEQSILSTIRIVQGLRTIDEQNALYAQGRTAPGHIVTNSKGGQSYHNYGLAVDFVLLKDGIVSWTVNAEWMKVVAVFQHAGFTWGGSFRSIKDYPHFEKTFGLNWRTYLQRYQAQDFIDGTQYVRIN